MSETTTEPVDNSYHEFEVTCQCDGCPAQGIPHTVRATYGFAAAACHWCAQKAHAEGREYNGHDISEEDWEKIRAIPEPPEHRESRLRMEALNRLLEREMEGTTGG
jgi:hypothetical protein